MTDAERLEHLRDLPGPPVAHPEGCICDRCEIRFLLRMVAERDAQLEILKRRRYDVAVADARTEFWMRQYERAVGERDAESAKAEAWRKSCEASAVDAVELSDKIERIKSVASLETLGIGDETCHCGHMDSRHDYKRVPNLNYSTGGPLIAVRCTLCSCEFPPPPGQRMSAWHAFAAKGSTT